MEMASIDSSILLTAEKILEKSGASFGASIYTISVQIPVTFYNYSATK
jgi:hypothetical protein